MKYNSFSFVPKFLEDIKEVLDKHEDNKWDVNWDGGELASIWNQINDIYWENKPDDCGTSKQKETDKCPWLIPRKGKSQ